MSILISRKNYLKKLELKKQKAIKIINEIADIKYTYGTLPYMADIELAKNSIDNIRD